MIYRDIPYFRENQILVYTSIWSDKSWYHDLKWNIPFQVVISCSMVYKPAYTWYTSIYKFIKGARIPDGRVWVCQWIVATVTFWLFSSHSCTSRGAHVPVRYHSTSRIIVSLCTWVASSANQVINLSLFFIIFQQITWMKTNECNGFSSFHDYSLVSFIVILFSSLFSPLFSQYKLWVCAGPTNANHAKPTKQESCDENNADLQVPSFDLYTNWLVSKPMFGSVRHFTVLTILEAAGLSLGPL